MNCQALYQLFCGSILTALPAFLLPSPSHTPPQLNLGLNVSATTTAVPQHVLYASYPMEDPPRCTGQLDPRWQHAKLEEQRDPGPGLPCPFHNISHLW